MSGATASDSSPEVPSPDAVVTKFPVFLCYNGEQLVYDITCTQSDFWKWTHVLTVDTLLKNFESCLKLTNCSLRWDGDRPIIDVPVNPRRGQTACNIVIDSFKESAQDLFTRFYDLPRGVNGQVTIQKIRRAFPVAEVSLHLLQVDKLWIVGCEREVKTIVEQLNFNYRQTQNPQSVVPPQGDLQHNNPTCGRSPDLKKHEVHDNLDQFYAWLYRELGQENFADGIPIKVELKLNDQNQLCVTGTYTPGELQTFLCMIKERLKVIGNAAHCVRDLPQSFMILLQNKESQEYVRERLFIQNVGVAWKLTKGDAGDYVQIFAANSQATQIAEEVIKGCMVSREYKGIQGLELCLRGCSIREKFQSLETVNSGKLRFEDDSFVATSDIEDQVIDKLQKIVSESLKKRSVVCKTEDEMTFIERGLPSMKPENVTIKREGNLAWAIHGPSTLVENCYKNLQAKVEALKTETCRLQDDQYRRLTESDTCIEDAEKRYNCCIAIRKTAGMLDKGRAVIQSKTCTFQDGKQCIIKQDSIETLQKGLIVNIKTEKDSYSGSNAMPHQATPSIWNIDAVIPKWKEGKQREKDIVRRNFRAIFELIELKEKYHVCALSLHEVEGRTGWPLRKLMECILYSFNESTKLKKLVFYHPRPDGFRKMLNCMTEFISTNGDAVDKFDSESSFLGLEESKELPSVQSKGVHIYMKRGHLANEEADVIVNTTSRDLKLDAGFVSKSILDKAGGEIQTECDKNYPSGIKYGDVAETKAYGLNASKVFHGSLPRYSNNTELKAMQQFVSGCLERAEMGRMKSILFPALGTGKLGYPHDQVANLMFRTAHEYVDNRGSTSIKEIAFIIFEKDEKSLRAFEDAQERWKRGTQTLEEAKMKVEQINVTVTMERVEECSTLGLIIFWTSGEIKPSLDDVNQKPYLRQVNSSVKTEWSSKYLDMRNNGRCISTSSSGLKIGSTLIHVKLDISAGESVLAKAIVDGLKAANEKKLKTVAISLASKLYSYRIKDIGKMFKQGVSNYCKGVGHSEICFIKVLIPDEKCYKEFLEAAEFKPTLKAIAAGLTSQKPAPPLPVYNLVIVGEDGLKIQQAQSALLRGTIPKMPKVTAPSEVTISEKKRKGAVEENDVVPENVLQAVEQNKGKEKEIKSVSLVLTEGELKCRLVCFDEALAREGPTAVLNFLKEEFGKKPGLQQIVYPFNSDTKALLKCATLQDAERIQGTETFKITPLEPQAVVNVEALLSTKMMKILQSVGCNASKITENSGVTVLEDNGCFKLVGSLPEISAAHSFLSKVVKSEVSYVPVKSEVKADGAKAVHSDVAADKLQSESKVEKINTVKDILPDTSKYAWPELECDEFQYSGLMKFFPTALEGAIVLDKPKKKMKISCSSQMMGTLDECLMKIKGMKCFTIPNVTLMEFSNLQHFKQEIEEKHQCVVTFRDGEISILAKTSHNGRKAKGKMQKILNGSSADAVEVAIDANKMDENTPVYQSEDGSTILIYAGQIHSAIVKGIIVDSHKDHAKMSSAGRYVFDNVGDTVRDTIKSEQKGKEEVFAAGPGNLKSFSNIILYIPPSKMKFNAEQYCNQLSTRIFQCLKKAGDFQLESVALAVLNEDSEKLSLTVAEYSSTIIRFLEDPDQRGRCPREIHVVSSNPTTVDEMKKAVESTVMTKAINATECPVHSRPKQIPRVGEENPWPYLVESGAVVVSPKLMLFVSKGDLTSMIVDLIAVAEDTHFQGVGAISKALISKSNAYKKIQKKLSQKYMYPSAAVAGVVEITQSGGDFPFLSIAHVVMPPMKNDQETISKISHCVKSMLLKIHVEKFQCLACPFFGSGGRHTRDSLQRNAEGLVNAIFDFAKSQQKLAYPFKITIVVPDDVKREVLLECCRRRIEDHKTSNLKPVIKQKLQ